MDEELDEIKGFSATHWICEWCSEENHEEGDVSGQIVECAACEAKFMLIEVR